MFEGDDKERLCASDSRLNLRKKRKEKKSLVDVKPGTAKMSRLGWMDDCLRT